MSLKIIFQHTTKYYFISILFLLSVFPIDAQKGSMLYLENAETLSFDKESMDCQVLLGNVRFRQDNIYLYCDTAYFYDTKNTLHAFGNVRIRQGDTLNIYGKRLYYDGNNKLARVRGKVRMINKSLVLETDSLNYDRQNNKAYYNYGGKLSDKDNVLTSTQGIFFLNSKINVFRQNVRLQSPDLFLTTDSLKYNSNSKIVYFISPTNMKYQEKTKIYSERGWYNTQTETSQLLKNAFVEDAERKRLKGDSILYNKKKGIAEVFHRVEIRDSAQNMSIFGNYAYYNENTKSGLVKDSALMVDYSSKDTLYLHAKLLKTSEDSASKIIKGIGNVRFFRNDTQGRCDSLIYLSQDSVINMYSNPVLWSDNNQLSGDFIQIYQRNNTIDWVHVQKWAYAIVKEDSVHYNQLSGKDLKGYIRNGELYKIEVSGNAESIYFPKEEDGTLIGMNKSESSKLTVYTKDKKVDRIILSPASKGVMYPLEKVKPEQMYLAKFNWMEDIRPKTKNDVFYTETVKEKSKEKKKRKR